MQTNRIQVQNRGKVYLFHISLGVMQNAENPWLTHFTMWLITAIGDKIIPLTFRAKHTKITNPTKIYPNIHYDLPTIFALPCGKKK